MERSVGSAAWPLQRPFVFPALCGLSPFPAKLLLSKSGPAGQTNPRAARPTGRNGSERFADPSGQPCWLGTSAGGTSRSDSIVPFTSGARRRGDPLRPLVSEAAECPVSPPRVRSFGPAAALPARSARRVPEGVSLGEGGSRSRWAAGLGRRSALPAVQCLRTSQNKRSQRRHRHRPLEVS